MTKGFLKSPKGKLNLYERLVKKRSPRNESIYEAYKSLFESLKKKSKKLITQDVLKIIKIIQRNCEM